MDKTKIYEVEGVEYLGDGKYKIYVELGRDMYGKRRRRTKTVTPTSERNLKKLKREFELKCMSEKEETLEDISFVKFVEKWRKNHLYHLKENTITMYDYVLDTSIIDHFKNMKLKDIRRMHIVEYLKKQDTLGKTKHVVLKSIFGQAVRWEVIDSNPTDYVKVPEYKTKRPMNYYTEEEMKHVLKVLDKVNPKHRIMVKLALIGGLRRSEVAGIREEKINFEENYIEVDKQLVYSKNKGLILEKTKNKKARKVFFPETFMKELKKYVTELRARRLAMGDAWKPLIIDGEPVNLIIVRDDGYPTNPQSISKEWTKIVIRHKLKYVTFHQLRHSCASLMVKNGVNFKVIQERLGHSNIAITINTYSHLEVDQHIESTNVFSEVMDD